MPVPERALMIPIVGSCRSGTGGDPALIARNMRVMDEAALAVFRRGLLHVAGEWSALPLIRATGSTHLGDATWDPLFHAVTTLIAARCDACLRIGGPSVSADAMAAIFARLGRPVMHHVEDLPLVGAVAA